ncbi:MAG: cytidylate kinase family protein [Actinobacteria bacterium]|nr:cytidylate kinase family protein [Actinomycetota bacterium]
MICISRQLGSHGKVVGASVAKALGYGFADSHIVHLLSQRAGLPETLVAE